VRVNWTQADHRLALTISDDGCGFVSAEAGDERHFGLRGMRERALMLGGNLEIASQPGQGTTLTLQVDV
jgi:signal transduction histidine kinase